MTMAYPRSFSWAIYFSLFVFAIQLTMMGPLIAKIAKSLNVSVPQIGSLWTFWGIGFVVAIMIAGIVADRIGKKKVIVVAVFGLAISLILFVLSNQFWISAFIFMLTGVFGGTIESMLSALITQIRSGNEKQSIMISQIYFGLGAIVGIAGAGFIAGSSSPWAWQLCYLISGVLCFIAAVWVVCYKYPQLQPDERIDLSNFKTIVMNRRYLALCFLIAIYVGVEFSVFVWSPLYLTSELNYSSTNAGLIVSTLWIAMTVGRICNAWLVAKFRTTTLIQILCIISILGLASNYFDSMRIFALPLIIIIGLGLSGIWPLLVGEAGTQFSKKYSGTAFGFAIASGGIGSMVLPYAFGFFSASYSMSTLISILSLLMLFIMVVYLIIEKYGLNVLIK